MKLYYKKYGLNQRGVAPFFDPEPLEVFNYDKEIDKLVYPTGPVTMKKKKSAVNRKKSKAKLTLKLNKSSRAELPGLGQPS